mgnify:CR=1 FL=1
MAGYEVYSKLKALIGVLETQLEKVDKESLTQNQLSILDDQTQQAWDIFCRREIKRGAYKRRDCA